MRMPRQLINTRFYAACIVGTDVTLAVVGSYFSEMWWQPLTGVVPKTLADPE